MSDTQPTSRLTTLEVDCGHVNSHEQLYHGHAQIMQSNVEPVQTATQTARQKEEPHPFETDPGDHAETPFEAYEHLGLLLTRLAKRLGTTKAALRIYDPFYCEGRMVQHLCSLGFESVYNKNEDFYAVKAAGQCPEYDVLVTNPPFSGDHMERIYRFAVKSNTPWCLLLPQYVARKAFYLDWLHNQRPRGMPKPCFVAPTQRPYVFTAPNRADVREMRLKEQTADNTSTEPTNEAAAAAEAEAAAAAEASLSALTLGDGSPLPPAPAAQTAVSPAKAAAQADCQPAAATPPSQSSAAAETAGAAAETEAAEADPFQVAAGSFQCVWFCHLGERHHKPVVEWLQQQLQLQQQQQQQGQTGEDGCAVNGPTYTVVASVKDVPQLMAVQKLSPAERRWRKKQQTVGQTQGSEQQQQQQQQSPGQGRSRTGSGRQQAAGGGSSIRQSGRQSQQRSGRRQQHVAASGSGHGFALLQDLEQ